MRVRNLTNPLSIERAEELALQLIDPIYNSMPIADSMRVPDVLAGVAAVIEDGSTIGVVHWTAEVDAQLIFQRGGREDLAVAFGREVRGLQNIAVAKDHQGKGVGTALNEHFLEMAHRDGIKTVIGVATGGSASFFEKAGYTVLPPGDTLLLSFPPAGSDLPFPIDPPSSWFFRHL